MNVTLTADQLRELTGYKIGAKQCAWIKAQLGIDPPMGKDGRPRLTKEVVDQAMLARLPGVAHTAKPSGPNWTK